MTRLPVNDRQQVATVAEEDQFGTELLVDGDQRDGTRVIAGPVTEAMALSWSSRRQPWGQSPWAGECRLASRWFFQKLLYLIPIEDQAV
jgi:hypothetical protein